MALVIRLRQQGKNNQRTFRLIVTDTRTRRDGKYIEKLGFYDPRIDGALEIDGPRVKYWLDNGALISERAQSLVLKKAPEVIKQYKESQQVKKLKLLQKKKASKKKAGEKKPKKEVLEKKVSKKEATEKPKKEVSEKKAAKKGDSK